MTPAVLLKTLRARGYTVALERDGSVSATGATPKDPVRAAQMLMEHHAGLRIILEAEEVLGAVLK